MSERKADAWVRCMPDWTKKGLTPVVDAIERADVPALITALDQVDPGLLNRHVQLKYCAELGDTLGRGGGANPNPNPNPVLFDAHGCCDVMGRLPCSLLACLLFVLSDYTFNDTDGSFASAQTPIPEHTNDEWVAVVAALVNHPKMDVNTVVTILQQGLQSIQYAKLACEATKCAPRCAFGWEEDCMSPWDYLVSATIETERKLGKGHPLPERGVRLLCVLAASGKLDMERELHMYYHSNVRPQGPAMYPFNVTYEFELWDVFKTFLALDDDLIMPYVWTFYRDMVLRGGADLECNKVPFPAIKARIAKFHLKIWRRGVRMRTLLGRAWGAIREKSYAPGGAGAKRARANFESICN